MPKKSNLEEFIKKSELKFGKGKFDFSNSIYINRDTKLIIICLIHGETLQAPTTHINSKYGCYECANEAKRGEYFEDKKLCACCEEVKDKKEFPNNKNKPDGLYNYCKVCTSKKAKEKRIPNPKRVEKKELAEKGLKRCCKCKEIKNYKEFNRSSKRLDGYYPVCKECTSKKSKNKTEKQRNKSNKNSKLHRKNCTEVNKNKSDEEIFSGSKKCSCCKKEKEKTNFFRKNNNKDGLTSQCKNCINKYGKIYRNKKYKINLEYRFITIIRGRIGNFLKGKNKSQKTKELLGYTYEDFKNFMLLNPDRIQDGYTFNDWIDGKLTLDHIIPISIFPRTDEGIRKFSQLRNLRLITKSENSRKQAKVDLCLIRKFELEYLYKSLIV